MPYAFISFIEADLDIARLLAVRLESAAYSAWVDERPASMASPIPEKAVADAIEFCTLVVGQLDCRETWRYWKEEGIAMDKIRLSEEERAKLEQLLRRGKAKARMIKRAHIVLKSAAGWGLEQIAETVGVSEARVSNVRRR